MTDSEIALSAMRKTSWRILPLLGMGYLVAYMDRANISFAALQMNADLGFNASVYGLGAGLFFLSYALCEVPSNIFLAKVGARRWMARIMISWGLVAGGMMFVRTPQQFYVMRFLLGVAEAGFFPGVIFYLSQWFPKRYRGRAISRYYLFSSVAGIVMGAVSGWLLSLGGLHGLRGWQWLFLMTSLPAFMVGVLILRFLPDSRASVTWLTEDERNWIDREIQSEAHHGAEPALGSVLGALSHPLVSQLGLFGLLTVGASVTLLLSIPQLLTAATGLDPVRVGWITSVGSLLGALGILLCGIWADRRSERLSLMLTSTAAVGVAYLVLALGLGHSALLVVLVYLVWMFITMFVAACSVIVWPDLLPPRLLAVGIAAVNTMTQIGSFVMPYAWGRTKDATGSFHAGLYALAVVTLAAWMIGYRVARGTNKESTKETAIW